MTSKLALFTLGPVRLVLDGQTVAVPRLKAVALLVYLAVSRRGYRREELAAMFWPQSGQAEAFAYLRQVLYQLRKTLGDGWLRLEGETVALEPGQNLWLDVHEFTAQLEVLRAHGHALSEACEACGEPLARAVELYRGDFLAGFALRDSPEFDQWQLAQAEALRREYAGALERLAELAEIRGDYPSALDLAQRWAALDLLDEEPQRALMRLYALSGQRAAALRQYQDCERRLREELNIAPEPATRELAQRIRTKTLGPRDENRAVLKPLAAPPPAELSAGSSTLPHFTTPFIGRQAELAEIHRLLADPACRLLTLVAPGGMGKTRLAGQAAHDLQPDFPQGVFYLSLASLASSEALVRSLLNLWGIFAPALESRSDPVSPRQKLFDFLHARTCLLVLDNCEHLVELPAMLQAIIEQAPGVKLLATSRQRLNLRGEWVLEIGGLPAPPSAALDPGLLGEYDAAQLFLQSARRIRASYAISLHDVPALVRIIQLVGGMPLGLELAAAWVSTLSIEEIAAEIERSLDFLATDMPDVPERQRSLQATFEYSWNLLSLAEQRLFASVSVFRGGFTRQAAQAVTGLGLGDLMRLVGCSLLQRTSEMRYELHSLLQFYAAKKLGEMPGLEQAIYDQHSAYFCTLLADLEKAFRGSYRRSAVTEMRPEMANVCQAWDWALAHRQLERLDLAMESLMELYSYYYRWDEGLAVCQAGAVALGNQPAGEEKRLLARLLTWQTAFLEGEYETVQELTDRAVALLEEPDLASPRLPYDRAQALMANGSAYYMVKNVEKARERFRQSIALLDGIGEKYWKANALASLGDLALLPPYNEAESQRYYQQSLALRRELGDSYGLANLLFGIASRQGFILGQVPQAIQYFQEAVEILETFGDLFSLAFATQCQDNILVLQGRFQELKEVRLREVEIYREIGNPARYRYALAHLGEACQMLGDYAQGEALGREAVAEKIDPATSFYGAMSRWFFGLVLLATEKFSEARPIFQSLAQPALEWDTQSWISNAYFGLSFSAWSDGNLELARWSLGEALRNIAQDRHDIWVRYPLAMAALLLAQEGQGGRALEIYTLVSRHPFVANSRWFADVFWRRIEPAVSTLSSEEAAAARQNAARLDLWQVVNELAR